MAARAIWSELGFVERRLPLRPRRLGTLRRKAKGLPRRSEATAFAAAFAARSLDTEKDVLETSCGDWLKVTETARDRYEKNEGLRTSLIDSLYLCWSEGINPQRQRDWENVTNCQSQWIGYRATCCHDAIAVPIGCGHRLCPQCNAHRSARYRERVRGMFGRLEHPVFLTLTVPAVDHISKRTYSGLRMRIRKLLANQAGWIKGGVYALETTYNRNAHTWHVHAHCLLDTRSGLPVRRDYFIDRKRRIEFDWLRLTGHPDWRPRDYGYWYRKTLEKNSREWNRTNRRVVDIRRVRNRNGAAAEVFKYITKVSDFVDSPTAIDEFLTATRGIRMLQTFGSWYGFRIDDGDVNRKSWSHLVCKCGENQWEATGRVFREDVELDDEGKWRLRSASPPTSSPPPGPSPSAEMYLVRHPQISIF